MGEGVFDSLRASINRAEHDAELLRDIWLEVGPYGSELSSHLVQRLRQRFDFDDSE